MKRTLTTALIATLLLTSALLSFPIIQPVKATQNFSDSFDSGNADNWTQQMASWWVSNGEYRTSVGIVENALSTVNSLTYSDCVVGTQLKFTDAVGFRAGIVFRYSDNGHYYSLEMSNEYDKLDFVKYTSGDSEYGCLLAQAVITFTSNVNYQLRIEATGSTFSAYLNGQKVLTANDDAYTSGLVGLRVRSADASFDNFVVNGDKSSIPIATPTPQEVKPPIQPGTFQDDFTTDSSAWQYQGSAHRDTTGNYVVLTPAGSSQGGVAFLNTPIQGAFVANFLYKASDGYPGEGFTMFFYKQKYTNCGSGGSLAFAPDYQSIPGYGIEFDGWDNYEFQPPDKPANHIALIEGSATNHLTYVNDSRVSDGNWHSVQVEVQASSVKVSVDQRLVLQWSGNINRTFSGFGFSGAVGGGGYQAHFIDDVSITSENLHTSNLTISCVGTSAQKIFSVYRINGALTYSNQAIAGAPILLSYSVTGGASWQDLSLVYTDSDGGYSAMWLPTATGNYQLKASYNGNENTLGATNIISFAIEPCSDQSAFLIDSNSTITELSFDTANKELSFTVSGGNGTGGYTYVTIPKTAMNNTDGLKVLLDGSSIDYSAQSQNDFWLIYFTYHHSTHKVTVSLSSSTLTTQSARGFLEDYMIYIIAAAIAIIALILAVALKSWKRNIENMGKTDEEGSGADSVKHMLAPDYSC